MNITQTPVRFWLGPHIENLGLESPESSARPHPQRFCYNNSMDDKWIIEYYETANGSIPVKEFIDKLDVIARSKVADALDLLEEYGISLGLPHSKRVVGTQLWELRIVGGNNIRIFYIAKTGKTFLLLHGFQKKKQKTDTKEIKAALKRLDDYRQRIQN